MKIPVDHYQEARAHLRAGDVQAHLASSEVRSRWSLLLRESEPATLAVGGPLTDSVSVKQRGRWLVLSYELKRADGGGYTWARQEHHNPPRFTVRQGEKVVGQQCGNQTDSHASRGSDCPRASIALRCVTKAWKAQTIEAIAKPRATERRNPCGPMKKRPSSRRKDCGAPGFAIASILQTSRPHGGTASKSNSPPPQSSPARCGVRMVFPGARLAARLETRVRRKGQWCREVVH